MIREIILQGIRVTLEARAMGGLGWTWCYQIGGGEPVRNLGRLVGTETEAFEKALAAARAALPQRPNR